MTTATLSAPQRPSVRSAVHRKPTILKRPRFHQVKKATTQPVLLRNLRNRYARRRSSSINISTTNGNASDTAARDHDDDNNEEESSRRVCFHPRVRIKRVPSRLSYTEETRLAMWHSRKALKAMVSRNHAESAYEGRAWQEAPEEDEFTMQNGELVHPLYCAWCQDDSDDDDEDENVDNDCESTSSDESSCDDEDNASD